MMTGINGKLRFTVRFPFNNQMLRFGCHDPKSEDRALPSVGVDPISQERIAIIHFFPKEEYSNSTCSMKLPVGCEISWGWYDEEHTGFKSIEDFVKEIHESQKS